jgi:hypothetical protein
MPFTSFISRIRNYFNLQCVKCDEYSQWEYDICLDCLAIEAREEGYSKFWFMFGTIHSHPRYNEWCETMPNLESIRIDVIRGPKN